MYVARYSRGKHFNNGLSSYTGGKGEGGEEVPILILAATSYRNRVLTGPLRFEVGLNLVYFVPFIKIIAVNLLRYIPHSKLFSLRDR